MLRADLLNRLGGSSPQLKVSTENLARRWLEPMVERLDQGRYRKLFPKIFNDPVWGTLELLPWEIALMDSPFLQRLRGVRQLGFAHYVFPGAVHDRLEHSRGVLEAADRMLSRLSRNAKHRRHYGQTRDEAIPETEDDDIYVVRLAALLHDIGHGPFSHAIEPIIEERYAEELRGAGGILREAFEGVGSLSASEILAAMLLLTDAFHKVLNHEDFDFPAKRSELAMRLVARIVGSRSHLKATYLSGIVSGPVDADKLDYMARDGHHAGLYIGLDTERLISKLEVIGITPENVPPRLAEVRQRAENSPNRRTYDMGISLSGIGAYEQLIAGRVVLYDRIYYHHKVRVAEAMAQRLVKVAEQERGRPFTLEELFLDVSDDTMIEMLGGRLAAEDFKGGGPRARALATRISHRQLYHRALAFASRFIGGLEGFQQDETRDAERAAIWRGVTKSLQTFDQLQALEAEIFELAQKIGEICPDLAEQAKDLRPEHIIVDLPLNKAAPGGNLLLTRTQDDQIGLPNLFFDPERWSNAYEQQKRCGYVFCPREMIPLVSIAGRIVLSRRYRFGVSDAADRFTKTRDAITPAWIGQLETSGLIDSECRDQLKRESIHLSRIYVDDVKLPQKWVGEDPSLPQTVADTITMIKPGGFMSQLKSDTIVALDALAGFVQMIHEGGEFAKLDDMAEADLQKALRSHLRSLQLDVLEGAEFGGGETDLLINRQIVVENKVMGDGNSPLTSGAHYPFQARRYSMAVCTSLFFTVVAYKPRSESALLTPWKSLRVAKVPKVSDICGEIRLAVPYGVTNPSSAKKPD
jgi:hypothetical protein